MKMSGTTSMTTPTRVAKLDTRPRRGPQVNGLHRSTWTISGGQRGALGEDVQQDPNNLVPALVRFRAGTLEAGHAPVKLLVNQSGLRRSSKYAQVRVACGSNGQSALAGITHTEAVSIGNRPVPQLRTVSTPCTLRGHPALAASSRVDATFAMRSEMVRLQTTWAKDGQGEDSLIASLIRARTRLFAFDRGALPGQWVHAARWAALVSRMRAW